MIHRLLVLAIFLVGINFVHAASFDCSKVTTETEQVICDDPKLSQLDELMAHAYQQALRLNEGPYNVTYVDRSVIIDKQKGALSQRNTCTSNIDCLGEFYRNRIGELLAFTKFKTDDDANVIDSLLYFAPQFSEEDNLRYLASSQDGKISVLLTWSDGYSTRLLISKTKQSEENKVSEVQLDAYTLLNSDLTVSQNEIHVSVDGVDFGSHWSVNREMRSKWRLSTHSHEQYNRYSLMGEGHTKDYVKNSKDISVYHTRAGCSFELKKLPLDWDASDVVRSFPTIRPEFIFIGWGGDLFSPNSSEFRQFVDSLNDDELRIYAIHAFSAKQFETAKFAFEVLVDRSVPSALKDLKCVESTIAAEK